MRYKNVLVGNTLLLICFFVFSWWLMTKSFWYDTTRHQFLIERNEVGDFGLHLSLIRSFSWGNNSPAQLPFFPGFPLRYHYYTDFTVGLLERLGVRIDYALNVVSAMAFTLLLYLLYLFPQRLFGKSKMLGILSVVFFLFHSNFTFFEFLKNKGLSVNTFFYAWRIPDYIHKGPFDGSLVSTFFTLNVFLNQRHLIVGLAVSLGILYMILPSLLSQKSMKATRLIILGGLLGILAGVHSLVFMSTLIVATLMIIFTKKFRLLLFLVFPAILVASPYLLTLLQTGAHGVSMNPGFLAEKPLTLLSFLKYWIINLGVFWFILPLGYFWANNKQRYILISFCSLFILGNLFQLSYRIDHNHSLFNYFILIANMYIAYALLTLWKRSAVLKTTVVSLCILLTASGILDLLVIKNDFHYPVDDAPANTLIQWIKESTPKRTIFLSKQEIFDPVTLAGRRNYFGHTYYLSVMGYPFEERQRLVQMFFEAKNSEVLTVMRREGINYILLPKKAVIDFPYAIDRGFFAKSLPVAFQNEDVVVYSL